MKIAFACDHGGLGPKEAIFNYLKTNGIEVVDYGTFTPESCHYPEFALKAAEAVRDGVCDKAILVCSSGEGVCMAANKVRGIRAGIGYDDTVSRLMVEHNHAQAICFGALYMSTEDILRRIGIFLAAEEAHGRHDIRVKMIEDYENSL